MELNEHLSDEILQSLAAGHNDAATAAAQLHLAQCPACARNLAAYRQLFNWVEAMPLPEPAPDFAAVTAEKIIARAGEKSARRAYVFAGLFTLAAMVAAVILIFFAYGMTGGMNGMSGARDFFADLFGKWNAALPGGLFTWIAGALLLTLGFIIEKWLPRRGPLAASEK